MSNTRYFLATFGKKVSRAAAGTPYFASVLIAQAAQETGWGKSTLSALHNNYFGLKAGSKWKGATVNMNTGEVFNGKAFTVKSNFRKYPTIEAGVQDRISWMYSLNRYNAVAAATTPEEQARALQACGYATDPNYANNLINLIYKHNLKNFDKMSKEFKNIELAGILASLLVVVLSIVKFIKY